MGLERAIRLLDALIEKCGGPGGKPGPCPSGTGDKKDKTKITKADFELRVRVTRSVMKTKKKTVGRGETSEDRYEVFTVEGGKPRGFLVDMKVQRNQTSGGGYDRVVVAKDHKDKEIGRYSNLNAAKDALARDIVSRKYEVG